MKVYVLMENAKTVSNTRRGMDRPIKVSYDVIDITKENLKGDKWYSIQEFEVEGFIV